MCGIAGVWRRGQQPEALADTVRAMTDAIRHRGPDADGLWQDEQCGVALGHRRLAIVDLSPTGAQPMHSASGRYTIVFNGEVYNFRRLRAELEPMGATIAGTSDTAVMLAAFETWGVAPSIPKLHGMFVFAVWDSEERSLWMARDRLGEKPLFIAETPDGIAFASELKALRLSPGFSTAVNPLALHDVLRRGCTRGARTIFSAATKLLPGQVVRFWRDNAGMQSERHHYWSVPEALAQSQHAASYDSDDAAVTALDDLLTDVVQDEMISDVALGAFLSGGIDSSLIVALMQRTSATPVRTFTIGFTEASHDESPFARAVAAHLGTNHTEVMLSARDALDLVPRLPSIFDEPFADSSQLPTLLVADVTRRHVTVALSGDGGDELFGGYSQYITPDGLARRARRVPAFSRSLAAAAVGLVPSAALSMVSGATWSPNARSRLSSLLRSDDTALSYDALLSMIVDPRDVLLHDVPSNTTSVPWPHARTVEEARMAFDMQTYLPDDILVKVDRSAMAYSLETRAPLLDHRVVEFALAQPLHRKIRDGRGKLMLRQLLARYVPTALIDRPKRGFSIPLSAWLRGELRGWGSEMLSPDATLRRWFKPDVLAALWSEHQRGIDRTAQLWPVLMVLQWLRANDC